MGAQSSVAVMAATSPAWLHTLGQIAGTFLLVELLVALTIVCALMVGLAVAAWWLHRNVIPVVSRYGLQAQHVLDIAGRGSERIVERVASFNGARAGVLKGLRVFLFGQPSDANGAPKLRAAPRTRPVTRPISSAQRPATSAPQAPTALPDASAPEPHPVA